MQYRFFSFLAALPEEVQKAVNRFYATHRVVSVETERSYWALCICYVERENGPVPPHKSKVDYREVFNEQDFALFARLRSLRKTLAEQDGIRYTPGWPFLEGVPDVIA
jgi:hypothetical protein